MEQDILEKLRMLDARLMSIETSLAKIKKYFQVTLWITIILFVLPLLALVFVVPYVLNIYLQSFEGLL